MFVLGLMGSPRKNGNTDFLLTSFMNELASKGVETKIIRATKTNVTPCTGCGTCEKNGFCIFTDDMSETIYYDLRRADVVVLASPIYFYTVPCELKAIIDRTQPFWARKYRLLYTDPKETTRKGFLLSVGATKGKDLFDSIYLTSKYFFRGIGANFVGALTYDRVEEKSDLKSHKTVLSDVENAVKELLNDRKSAKNILFTGNDPTLPLVAWAYAELHDDSGYRFSCAADNPEEEINPDFIRYMHSEKIDLEYIKILSAESVFKDSQPFDHIVHVNGDPSDSVPISCSVVHWNIKADSLKSAFEVCNIIKTKVNEFF